MTHLFKVMSIIINHIDKIKYFYLFFLFGKEIQKQNRIYPTEKSIKEYSKARCTDKKPRWLKSNFLNIEGEFFFDIPNSIILYKIYKSILPSQQKFFYHLNIFSYYI